MPASPTSPRYRPKLDFMIVGAQKGGTTALAQFLRAHPDIAMPAIKEAHLFDGEGYSAAWSARDIDERYRPHFAAGDFDGGAKLLGEATPIYMFLPDIAEQLKRYNPGLRLIVLLRDPTQRAISHYRMERRRGGERLPLWLALLAEPLRQRRCANARAPQSAARVASYRSRGLYSRQLGNLQRWFDRRQVCVLRSEALLREHDATLRRVFAFLGVAEHVRVAPARVFAARGQAKRHRFAAAMLRLSYLAERRRLQALLRALDDSRRSASRSCLRPG